MVTPLLTASEGDERINTYGSCWVQLAGLASTLSPGAVQIDGFRFDIMGHLMLSTMQKIQAALRDLTEARDGVDGSKIYIYGEGWDFGEVRSLQP